jgi:hypothetical protein
LNDTPNNVHRTGVVKKIIRNIKPVDKDVPLQPYDLVRIATTTKKSVAQKGQPTYSKEIYIVASVIKPNNETTMLHRYRLVRKDTTTLMSGTYNISELQKI